MCMEDIRIGRKQRSSTTTMNYTSSVQKQIAGYDALRVGLILWPSNTNVYLFPGPDVGATNGILMTTAGPPIMLNIRDHGDLCQKSWHAIPNSGTGQIPVTEIHLEDR